MAETYESLIARFKSSRKGRGLLGLEKRFWGVEPQAITKLTTPGKGRHQLAFLGDSPAVTIADRPNGKTSKKQRIKFGSHILVTGDPSGRRMMILNTRKGVPAKPKLKFVGYVVSTEYIPTKAIEKAGSFKAKRHWWHEHKDRRGRWPRVWKDQNGNYYYGRATYYIGKRGWLER